MTSNDLVQKDRQLQLLIALDDIRDSLDEAGNPKEMFYSLARLLQQTFSADACAILLVDDASGEPEFLAPIGVPQDMAMVFCQEALTFREPQPLTNALWSYTLAVQVVMRHLVLGSLFVGRKDAPFADDAIELFRLAESQIDSAIIQARYIWKLAERNRELEAIYQIDLLRDNSEDENNLIHDFTSLLLQHFRAELCLIILNHSESGEPIIHWLVDKRQLPAETLHRIQNQASDLRAPQVIAAPAPIEELSLIAAPFIVSGNRLGAVVIGREEDYEIADNRLMYAMMSQMDSAIVKHRILKQLQQHTRELDTIYKIDQIRDMDLDFDMMLQRVLRELCQAVASETGYIMLYSADQEEPLELKASTTEDVLTQPDYIRVIKQFSLEALQTEQMVYSNESHDPVRSIVAIPLILNQNVIGVFGALNSVHATGFSLNDRRLLKAITSQVDTAVFERLERRRMRQVLSRSVDPKVLEALLQRADDSLLAGERVVLTVLFADLRGSTEWAERTDPEELVIILNTFLSNMTDIIFKHGGTLDKFVGDEVIALFGTPVPLENHAERATEAALEMLSVHKQLQLVFESQGKELPPMGVGVSSGEAIAGEYGPPIRTDFTAMGQVMNLGSRLCSAALGNQILVSEYTLDMLEDTPTVEALGPMTFKGIGRPVPIFELLEAGE